MSGWMQLCLAQPQRVAFQEEHDLGQRCFSAVEADPEEAAGWRLSGTTLPAATVSPS